MSHRSLVYSLLSALFVWIVLPLPSAEAADLDYNFGDAPPPVAQTKVEFGTGWYVRGDIAAKDSANLVALARTSSTSEAFGLARSNVLGYDLTLGGGYSFLNGLRGDVIVDFHQPTATNQLNQSCVSVTSTTCAVSGKFNGYDALFNGYYDFGTWYHITPYVGAGVGVGFGTTNALLTGDPNGTYQAKIAYHSFAYALMAGVAIDVYPHVKLDVGYRFLDNGMPEGSKIQYQEVRAGLRYMIDAP